MIKRMVGIIIPLFACAVLVAQDGGNVWRTWYLKPEAGKVSELGNGLKDHVEKYHGKGGWPEAYLDVLTGPNAGSYMGWSGPHTWKAFDDRERSEADFRHWNKNVLPYVDDDANSNISFFIGNPDLSYKPKFVGSTYYHLSYNIIRPGADSEYIEFLRAVKKTKSSVNNPLSHNIYRVVSGKQADAWIWEYPGDSMVEVSGSMQVASGVGDMKKVLGEKEAKRMNEIYQKVVKYRVRELLKFRPDLSTPSDNN